MINKGHINILSKFFFGRELKKDLIDNLTGKTELELVEFFIQSEEFVKNYMKFYTSSLENELNDKINMIFFKKSFYAYKGQYYERIILPYYEIKKYGKNIEQIFFKSLPRSGHHFLISLLTKYYAENIKYCEFYNELNCCKLSPCINSANDKQTNNYFFQKSHDFELKDIVSDDKKYIIQTRNIMERVQSDFELEVKFGKSEDSLIEFQKFALKKLDYTIQFYQKWRNAKNVLWVSYENLVQDTENELIKVINFIQDSNSIDQKRLAIALLNKNQKVNPLNSPKKIRIVNEHRYYDKSFHIMLENTLKERIEK